MLPTQTTLSALFQVQRRFVVPLYQRPYVWTEENHARLWEMTMDRVAQRALGRQPKPRFLGAIVLSPSSSGNSLRTDLIIDGQQRLTTIQIMLSAVRRLAKLRDLSQLYLLTRSMTENLISSTQPFSETFKVTPSKNDAAIFELCLNAKDEEKLVIALGDETRVSVQKLLATFSRFSTWIEEYLDDDEEFAGSQDSRAQWLLDALMNDLLLVSIDLNDGEDPQEIFETLNFGGTPLAPSDLLRNWILLRANQNKEDINALYEKYWKQFDNPPWSELRSSGRRSRMIVDVFVHHYLTAVSANVINVEKLYVEYKNWIAGTPFPTVSAELDQLGRYAEKWLALNSMTGSSPIARLARVAVAFEVGSAFPLLLALEASDRLTEAHREAIAAKIESFIVRREICRLSAKNYNNLFIELIKLITRSSDPDEVQLFLDSSSSRSSKFPIDYEFRHFLGEPLYGHVPSARLQWLLWELEEGLRSKKVEALIRPDGLHIEHILPGAWHQTWALQSGSFAPTDYDQPLSFFKSEPEYVETRERDKYVDRLGNLTLITGSLNQGYGNNPFHEKVTQIREFSLLRLNADVISSDRWDVAEIIARTKSLTDVAILRWPHS